MKKESVGLCFNADSFDHTPNMHIRVNCQHFDFYQLLFSFLIVSNSHFYDFLLFNVTLFLRFPNDLHSPAEVARRGRSPPPQSKRTSPPPR